MLSKYFNIFYMKWHTHTFIFNILETCALCVKPLKNHFSKKNIVQKNILYTLLHTYFID